MKTSAVITTMAKFRALITVAPSCLYWNLDCHCPEEIESTPDFLIQAAGRAGSQSSTDDEIHT